MTMPSKWLLLGCLFLAVGALYARPAGEVFQQHQHAILAGEATQEGYTFGVGSATARMHSSQADESARGRSRLLAYQRLLLTQLFRNMAWPPALPQETREALQRFAYARNAVSASVGGLEVVSQQKNGNTWTTIVALPVSQCRALPTLTFEALRQQALDEAAILSPNSLPLAVLCALRATIAPLPPSLDTAPWAPYVPQNAFPSTRLNRLCAIAGHYPLGSCAAPTTPAYAEGMKAFSEGRLDEAYLAFLRALDSEVSFAALNMAGNVGRRIGHGPEVIPLLLHASYLDPASAYPWVHLAFIAQDLPDNTLLDICLQAARQRNSTHPDPWVRAQLEALQPENTPLSEVTPSNQVQ